MSSRKPPVAKFLTDDGDVLKVWDLYTHFSKAQHEKRYAVANDSFDTWNEVYEYVEENYSGEWSYDDL